jgi:hypothetical protein
MLPQIDHVVFVGLDLDALIADYRARGFTVVKGGEHADGLSHNALVGFADGSYLELFAFHGGGAEGQHVWAPVARRGGGWADFALLSDDLAGDAAALDELVTRSPLGGGRKRPDGTALAWRSARLKEPLPFMIQDTSARELRVPDRGATKHPNGVRGVSAIVLGAREPASVRDRYRLLEQRGAPPVEIRQAEHDGLLDVQFS